MTLSAPDEDLLLLWPPVGHHLPPSGCCVPPPFVTLGWDKLLLRWVDSREPQPHRRAGASAFGREQRLRWPTRCWRSAGCKGVPKKRCLAACSGRAWNVTPLSDGMTAARRRHNREMGGRRSALDCIGTVGCDILWE